jgi:hypothetical protein
LQQFFVEEVLEAEQRMYRDERRLKKALVEKTLIVSRFTLW